MNPTVAAYDDLLATLHRAAHEALDGLPPAALDWSPAEGVNSVTVLIVHLTGAERYWIGDVVGQAPSARVRGDEFEAHAWTIERLRARLDEALAHSLDVLARLTPADLEATRLAPHGREHTVAWALGHALEHTAMHVGHLQLTAAWWRSEHAAGGGDEVD